MSTPVVNLETASFLKIVEWAKLFHKEKESSDKSFTCFIKSFDKNEKNPFEFRAKRNWFSEKIFGIIQRIKRVVGYRTYDLSYQLKKFLELAKDIPESDVRNYLSNRTVGPVFTEIKDFVGYLESCGDTTEDKLTDELKSIETKLTKMCSSVALEKFRSQLGDAPLEISSKGEVGYRISEKECITNSELFKKLEIDDVEMKVSMLKEVYHEKVSSIKAWLHQNLQEWRKPEPILFDYGKNLFDQIEKAFKGDVALAEYEDEIQKFFSKELNDRSLEILKLISDKAAVDQEGVRVVFNESSIPSHVEMNWEGKWSSLDVVSDKIVSENLCKDEPFKKHWKEVEITCLAASLKNKEKLCDKIACSIIEKFDISGFEKELNEILQKKSEDLNKIKKECGQVLERFEESGRIFLSKSLEFCEKNQSFLPEKTGEIIVKKFLEKKGKCIGKVDGLGEQVLKDVVIQNARVDADYSEGELENGLQDVKKLIEKKDKLTLDEKRRLHGFLDEIIVIADEIKRTGSSESKDKSKKLIDSCVREKERIDSKPLFVGKVIHLKYILKDSPGSTVAINSKVGKDIVVGASPNLVVESTEVKEGGQDYDEIYIENCPGAVVVYDSEIGTIIDEHYASTAGKVDLTVKQKMKETLFRGLVGGVAGATMGWMGSRSIYGVALGFLGGSAQAFLSFIPRELGASKTVSTMVTSAAIFTSTLFLRKQILSFGKQVDSGSSQQSFFDYFKKGNEAKEFADAVGIGVLAGAIVS